jgi:cell pole-organizing protein PopZ
VKNKGADATADDRKTLFQNFMAHSQKMDAAMRQQDPSIGPVLDEINAQLQQRIQQKTGGAGDASGT